MGTDIHIYTEAFAAGRWTSADQWIEEDGHLENKPIYDSRNYCLFTVLAGVRGVEGIEPIAEPRGMPEDADPLVAASYPEHSESWLTLKEILDYNWTQLVTRKGVVTAGQYASWSRYGKQEGEPPYSYCGSVWGKDVQIIDSNDLDAKLAEIWDGLTDKTKYYEAIETMLPSTYCHVEWKQMICQCCGEFWSKAMPQLLEIAKSFSNETVRIVFWFDS